MSYLKLTTLFCLLPFLSMAQSQNIKDYNVSADTLNSIYFYLDAAIIMPKSKPIVDDIYKELKTDPDKVVVLHGHTNGKNLGPIITLGDASDRFALTEGVNRWRIGTATALSKKRAESVKEYLIYKGIDEQRILIKGWGARHMIYDPHVEKSWYNARVEVEFLDKQ